MMLSPNFSLDEFLVSETAYRHGIDMTPPQKVIDNIQILVTTCLQPIREAAESPLIITSGYRPDELNTIINGSKTSAHRFGRAADFTVIGLTPFETCQLILTLDLRYDQLILEFSRWVHLGIAEDLPRYQNLTAVNDNGRTRYISGIEEV